MERYNMSMNNEYSVAVVGATGAVGREMIKTFEERAFPVSELFLFASKRSAGVELEYHGKKIIVEELLPESFAARGIKIALFSAGATVSKSFAPKAVEAGAIVIDNSSAFRMETDVPLVVVEVNPYDLCWHRGIIANPNCSTIQMVVALKPLHDVGKIKRIVVSTYQSVSGTGHKAIEELYQQIKAYMEDRSPICRVYPYPIAFNLLPHIDIFLENGYTKEEIKMVNETRKIMGEPHLKITATAVRVPIVISHSEAVNVEFEGAITPQMAREILSVAPGVVVVDDPQKDIYPYPIMSAGHDAVYVGRIREDESLPSGKGLNLWIVSDNLRKGAALNAVQIAESLIHQKLV